MDSAVHCGLARIVLYYNSGGCSSNVAGCVANLEGNRIDATIAVPFAFGAQLDRLAICCDDNVVQGIAISSLVTNSITTLLTPMVSQLSVTAVTKFVTWKVWYL